MFLGTVYALNAPRLSAVCPTLILLLLSSLHPSREIHIYGAPFLLRPSSVGGESARASGWMRPHLNARTYIGEMFNFMGHFAELYVGRAGIARIRRKNSDDDAVESRRTQFRFTNENDAAFGEIKKQLVSALLSFLSSHHRRLFLSFSFSPSLPFSHPSPTFSGSPVRRWNLVEARMTSFEVPR